MRQYSAFLFDMLFGGFGTYLTIDSIMGSIGTVWLIGGIVLIAAPYVFANSIEGPHDVEEMRDAIAEVKRETIIFTLIGVLIEVVIYLLLSL